ncbi:MAG: cation-transporting P-type ATPase [Frankiaceae bacterium]|nr:cation-transporting P-type ATPase [Frankiaceae bacterium]
MTDVADVAGVRTATGLSADAVRQRRERGLTNDYQPLTSRTLREILRANILTRFNALLGSLLVVIVLVGPFQDALFGVALVTNTLIGVVQEWRAKRALDRLAVVTSPHATVVRAGVAEKVAAGEVVLDDVIELAAGDQLVADASVLSSEGLRLDESLLTGESHPVAKNEHDALLSGSLVVAGSGRCVVAAVGAARYAAKLEAQARHFSVAGSELRDGLNRILRVITWVLVPTAGLLFWSQLSSSGTTTADALRGAVAGTVTMVPEGLILLASVAFAVGAMRLARRRVLARELPSIEGLARVDTLCIDKTGTLTTGRLTVADVVELEADAPVAAALAALARVDPRPNATALAMAERFPAETLWPARSRYPFSSETKWSGADFGLAGIWLIGAPDVLLPAGHEARQRVDALAAGGARVLLLARGNPGPTPAAGASPIALVVLRDEIRVDAAETLAYLRAQGVAVKVLSGDHPKTVAAVATEVGLQPGEPVDARTADPATLPDRVVFGRVTPEQKRAFVDALRREGHVVAMTGDGINDVLALKNADVGIAMGAGSAATRAVAQLVLLDNAFTAVPDIIAEGRRVIANMERVANLFLTKTVYATVLAITVGIAKLPFPFLPRHLTLISTLTIGVPAFFLALAPNAARARPHFVARVARFAVPTGLIAAGATYLAYVEARADSATSLPGARTLSTVVLFAIALWVLAILERLGQHRERWLVPLMALGFLIVLAVPAARLFFALAIPRPLVIFAGVGVAALAGVALEFGWLGVDWVQQLRRGRANAAAGDVRL